MIQATAAEAIPTADQQGSTIEMLMTNISYNEPTEFTDIFDK